MTEPLINLYCSKKICRGRGKLPLREWESRKHKVFCADCVMKGRGDVHMRTRPPKK